LLNASPQKTKIDIVMKRRDASGTLIAIRGVTRLIMDGELKAGDRVSQVSIASALEVDRASVQLAFERLKRQGVLDSGAGGGFVVRSFTVPQVEDAIFLRGQLEGAAARLATQRSGATGVSDLIARVTDLDHVVDDTEEDLELSLARYRELNDAFHAELFALADSDVLTDAYESLVALPFAQPSAWLVYGSQDPILSVPIQFGQIQHRKILKAIESGDSEEAEMLARHHADLARYDMRAVMRRGAAIGMLPGSGLIVSTEGQSDTGEANGSSGVLPARRILVADHLTREIADHMTREKSTGARSSPTAASAADPHSSAPENQEPDGHRSGVQVISRVAAILQILGDSRSGLTLTQVVTQTGLPKTTAYRILSALQEEELIESIEGRYRLGREGRGDNAGTEEVRLRARPLMERVAAEVQETVDLTILVDDQVMIIEQILRPRDATAGPMIGSRLPALQTASGLALLACSPNPEQSEFGSPRLGARFDQSERLAARLARIREEGIAVSVNDIPGILAMATAATDETGLAFALGVPVPRDRSGDQAPLIRDVLLRARPEFARLVANN
jgi:GntR family transcriptional regulator of vanillate catabolism